jgi:hypothetical protein
MEIDQTIVDAMLLIGKIIDNQQQEYSDDDLDKLNTVWNILNKMIGTWD